MKNLFKIPEFKVPHFSRMIRIIIFILSFCILHFALISDALAVPETAGVRITDVTTSSFSVVWMTDVSTDPAVEVYSDSSMTSQITDKLIITPMPAGSQKVIEAARSKGIMKVRVSGLTPSTRYYVRTVTKDPSDPQIVSRSSLQEAVTASRVIPYRYSNGIAQGFSNDLVSFKVYIRPSEIEPEPGTGDLMLLEQGASYPLSSFVGDWVKSPEGIIDLNNLFDIAGLSLNTVGGEKIVLRIYRAGGLSALTHYRRIPQDGNMVYVAEPVKGFFADINLDSKVDEEDFAEFKKQYRTMQNDASYNPDFDFIEDPEGKVDAREFSKFSKEYGRTDVE